MPGDSYDIITVGGGLGGSALAVAMARKGHRVLVLEAEEEFRDRVRGEQLASWGVAESKELGIYDTLMSSCAHEEPWFDFFLGPMQINHRNMAETTPSGLPNLTFFHPEMQEALLREAAAAGADVKRGARARGVEPGERPAVLVEDDGDEERIEARLVVGADGRNSMVRKWAGFETQRDPDLLQIGGIMMKDCPLPEDTARLHLNPSIGTVSPIFPQGGKKARLYLVTRVEHGPGHSGEKDLPAFLEGCERAGVDEAVLKSAKFEGPLATFKGAATWVEHAYRNGVALIGDAASHSDPAWGQGLSITLRDVRVLRDMLLETDDWDAAGDAYAEEQQGAFQKVRKTEEWFTDLLYSVGPEADARRGRALPLIAQDDTRMPDTFQSGPDSVTLDEAAYRRMFGEE